jgi:hypothetical protein
MVNLWCTGQFPSKRYWLIDLNIVIIISFDLHSNRRMMNKMPYYLIMLRHVLLSCVIIIHHTAVLGRDCDCDWDCFCDCTWELDDLVPRVDDNEIDDDLLDVWGLLLDVDDDDDVDIKSFQLKLDKKDGVFGGTYDGLEASLSWSERIYVLRAISVLSSAIRAKPTNISHQTAVNHKCNVIKCHNQ